MGSMTADGSLSVPPPRQGMQFGVLQFFAWPDRNVPLADLYERSLARIEVMDRSGAFDAVWLAEHHFSTFSVCPSVHVMGTMAAARTRNLRIGMAVSLAAMYHPLRLAEELALLDVLSGGRLNWGAGRGNDPTEFGVFGLDMASSYELFRENVDIVLRAWQEDRLTYEGSQLRVKDLEVLPKPLQQPHPPVWLAASSPEAIGWAASEGHSILMDPHSTHGDIGVKFRGYEEALGANGHDRGGRVTPMARMIAVAQTDDEAKEVAVRGARGTVRSMADPARRGLSHRLRPTGATSGAGGDRPRDPVDRYVDEVIVHGCASRVVDEISRLRDEIGLHYLLCAPLSNESFKLLTNEVIPKLS
jgi:alkanesulfonate monooxygenase SsuD/methylene tetrahydromethanopterin reductase-like flavin-dependent oxidoreductase (luciferase family)